MENKPPKTSNPEKTTIKPATHSRFVWRKRFIVSVAALFLVMTSSTASASFFRLFTGKYKVIGLWSSGYKLKNESISMYSLCNKSVCYIRIKKLLGQGGTVNGPVFDLTNRIGLATRLLINGNSVTNSSTLRKANSLSMDLLRNSSPVGSGSLSSIWTDGYVVLEASAVETGPFTEHKINFGGDAIGVPPTCTVPDDVIKLPSIKSEVFTGVGSVSGATPFSLRFNNCSPYLARVNYQINPVGDLNPNIPGLLPADTGTLSRGVGIQIVDSAEHPVAFNQWIPLTDYDPNAGGSYSVELIARYMQTDSLLKGGKINGKFTVLLNYQ